MAKEIADTGQPQIIRPDRDELLSIDELMAKAADELKKLDESYAVCALPAEPDVNQIERRAIEIRKAWYCKFNS